MTPPDTTDVVPASGTADRVDALVELGFTAEIQGREIGRFAECTGLAVEYEMLEYAEGGNNDFVHRLRGRARYPTVVLRRGVTFEDELMRWFFESQQPEERPTVTITILDPEGNAIRHWALDAAQPVRCTGPDSAAKSSAGTATEALEISHQGFL